MRRCNSAARCWKWVRVTALSCWSWRPASTGSWRWTTRRACWNRPGTSCQCRPDNIEFISAIPRSELQKLQADCVVINMVLHHTPEPARILSDVADCLAPGGVVLVTDLCSHDQGWARENCGDLWLGFDPQDSGLGRRCRPGGYRQCLSGATQRISNTGAPLRPPQSK